MGLDDANGEWVREFWSELRQVRITSMISMEEMLDLSGMACHDPFITVEIFEHDYNERTGEALFPGHKVGDWFLGEEEHKPEFVAFLREAADMIEAGIKETTNG